MGQADLGPLDLPFAGLAPQVGGHLVDVRDAGGAERVALGQQAAGDVDRDLPVAPRAAAVDPLAGAAFGAERVVVVVGGWVWCGLCLLLGGCGVFLLGFVFNWICPRAILARVGFRELVQESNKLKIAGLNGIPSGLKPKLAGTESLIPTKNG